MKKIPFKAIVVDVDGTFVNSHNEFDHLEFKWILRQLKERNIHFIVASGRPAARLKEDFTDFDHKIDFIADNGAVLIHDNQVIRVHAFAKETIMKVVEIIKNKFPSALAVTLISGVKHTYCLKTIPDDKKKMMFFYYPNTICLDDFTDLPDDQYTKITISYPNTIGKDLEKEINQISQEKVCFKTSGFENIDLVLNNVNKANGLSDLLKYLKVSPQEIIAFGDSGNDIEMLKMTPLSYAMANGSDEIKHVAKFQAPSNDDDGVFQILKQYIN